MKKISLDDLLEDFDLYRTDFLNSPIVKQYDKDVGMIYFNIHSNLIEGNKTNYDKAFFLLSGKVRKTEKTKKEINDELEILRYQDAIEIIVDLYKDEYNSINPYFIRLLHKLMFPEGAIIYVKDTQGNWIEKEMNGGQYKTEPNSVLKKDGTMFNYSMPFEVSALMQDLSDWYKREEQLTKQGNGLHPIILATMLKYKFLRIHPFDDGNGRVSRLLMNYVLLRFGYGIATIVSYKKERYLNALEKADGGEFSVMSNDYESLHDLIRLIVESL